MSERQDREGSALERLSTGSIQPPPPRLSAQEREELAQKRVGTTIKGWRLARLLGVGPVTAAYETFRGPGDGGEHVTLKLLLGSLAQHDRARALFLRGSYAANRFSHPRVVPVLGDGTDADGAPFYVRPWVDAEPLMKAAEKRDLGEAGVLRFAEQVLDVLEIAHAQGLVHGALTPNNILVTPRGSIRLCDFAAPPGMGPRGDAEDDVLAERRASPFSAPERCSAGVHPASEQSDIYELAACMYYAITRKPPRGDATERAVLASTPAIPLAKVAPGVTEYFAMVVDYALSEAPEARYESAYAMLGDVRRVLAGRRPKLGDGRPNPSGSFGMTRLSGQPPSTRAPALAPLGTPSEMAQRDRGPEQWKGNLMLILAIALLVGIATFVMVRERVDEERGRTSPAEESPR